MNECVDVKGPVTILTKSLPAATKGEAYSVTLAARGGTTPYTWAHTGSLPLGIKMKGDVISGTALKSGSFSIVVKVRDSSKPETTASQSLTLTVSPDATSHRAGPQPAVKKPPAIAGGFFVGVNLGWSRQRAVPPIGPALSPGHGVWRPRDRSRGNYRVTARSARRGALPRRSGWSGVGALRPSGPPTSAREGMHRTSY